MDQTTVSDSERYSQAAGKLIDELKTNDSQKNRNNIMYELARAIVSMRNVNRLQMWAGSLSRASLGTDVPDRETFLRTLSKMADLAGAMLEEILPRERDEAFLREHPWARRYLRALVSPKQTDALQVGDRPRKVRKRLQSLKSRGLIEERTSAENLPPSVWLLTQDGYFALAKTNPTTQKSS